MKPFMFACVTKPFMFAYVGWHLLYFSKCTILNNIFMKYKLDNNSLLSPLCLITKIQATNTPSAAGANAGTAAEAPTAEAATKCAALKPAVAAHTEPIPATAPVLSILAWALWAVAFSEFNA